MADIEGVGTGRTVARVHCGGAWAGVRSAKRKVVMAGSFLPKPESALLDWGLNLARALAQSPGTLGVSPEAAAAFAAVCQQYRTAHKRATNTATRTAITIAAKNAAKESLKAEARVIVRTIEGHGVSDVQRIDLGLNIRRAWSRVPTPTSAPCLTAAQYDGRRMRVRVWAQDQRPGRLLDRASGVHIWVAWSDDPSSEPSGWQLATVSSKASFVLDFDGTIGDTVWLAAAWCNPRGEVGPRSFPVSVSLPRATVRLAA